MGRAGVYQRRQIPRNVPAERRGSRRLLARAGQAHRMDQALHQGEERQLRLPRRLHQMVRGRLAQPLGQLHRPAPEGPRRPGGDHLGGRRPGRRQEDHLSRAARACLPHRQRHEGLRREEGRPGDDLHADDPGGGLCHARLSADRRHPFRRVRRLLARLARQPHRGLPLRLRHHCRRRRARRQAHPAEGQYRQGDRPRRAGRRACAPRAGRQAHRQPGALRGATATSGTTRRSRRSPPTARRRR